jgi:hypothetical protein
MYLEKKELHHIELIQIKVDKEPESSKIRVQFFFMMVEFVDKINTPIQMNKTTRFFQFYLTNLDNDASFLENIRLHWTCLYYFQRSKEQMLVAFKRNMHHRILLCP